MVGLCFHVPSRVLNPGAGVMNARYPVLIETSDTQSLSTDLRARIHPPSLLR